MSAKAQVKSSRPAWRVRIRAAVMVTMLLSTILLSHAAAFDSEEAPAEGFHFQLDEHGGVLRLFEGDAPVLTYCFSEQLKQGVPADRTRCCYLHPLFGLNGEALTDDFPKDHYHHRGVSLMWPNVRVGDRWLDLWHLNGLRPHFNRWLTRRAGRDRAVIAAVHDWKVGERTVAHETMRVEAHRADADSRAIDIAYRLQAIGAPLTLRGEYREGKGYGGFNVRFAPRASTKLITDRGETAEDSLHTRYRWAGLFGQFRSDETWSGLVVFPYPNNPDLPTSWILRNYGFVGVCWPGVDPLNVHPDQPVSLKYRIIVYRTMPKAQAIERTYQKFIAGLTSEK